MQLCSNGGRRQQGGAFASLSERPRSHPSSVTGVSICTGTQEQANNLVVPLRGGDVQWRPPLGVLGVRAAAALLQESLDEMDVARESSHVKGRVHAPSGGGKRLVCNDIGGECVFGSPPPPPPPHNDLSTAMEWT